MIPGRNTRLFIGTVFTVRMASVVVTLPQKRYPGRLRRKDPLFEAGRYMIDPLFWGYIIGQTPCISLDIE